MDGFLCVREEAVNLQSAKGDKECTLVVPEDTENLGEFLDLHTAAGEAIPYPEKGEAVLTKKMADKCNLALHHIVKPLPEVLVDRYAADMGGFCYQRRRLM